jgi:beta-lactamase class A
MNMRVLSLLLPAVVIMSIGCSPTSDAVEGVPDSSLHSADSTPVSSATPDPVLRRRIGEIAENARGKVGVHAYVIETGETVGLNQNDRFAMQSVVKLPIAMAVLKQVDDGKLSLDQPVKFDKTELVPPRMHSPIREKHPEGGELLLSELLRAAVSESDGTASDVLQRLAGGADGVQKYIDSIGIVEIEIRHSHKEFYGEWEMQYDNWASPEGATALLDVLHKGDGVSAASRELLLKFMTETKTGPNRLKGMLPAGTEVAHKTGTSATRNGVTASTNDAGIIKLPDGSHMVIAVFVRDSAAGEKTRDAVIAGIAKAIWDHWTDGN